MKEKLLVLAKAAPQISKKYEHLVCVAGLTEKGEWRRIYPIPWKIFWKNSEQNFKKKTWIEYELKDNKPSDHRPESRKIKFNTIKPLEEASFNEIEKLLKERLTTMEELEAKGPKIASLGVIKPLEIIGLESTTNQHYEELITKSKQTTLENKKAIKLEIPELKYRYIFRDDKNIHENLCEDWELSELYRKCEQYRKEGKYKDKEEVNQKIKEKMLNSIIKKNHVYFIMGSHYRFPTYMIISIIYPKAKDLSALNKK